MRRLMKSLAITLITALVGVIFLVYGDFILFNIAYIFTFLYIALKNILRGDNRKNQIYVVAVFAGIMVIELVFNTLIVFGDHETHARFLFSKIIGTVFVYMPFILEGFVVVKKYDSYDFPSMNDTNVISYADLMYSRKPLTEALENLKNLKGKVTREDIIEIIGDLPRHSSFKYVNKDSLAEAYFTKAYETLNDEHIYIVLSNTGSTASEIISMFTKKVYNHASLSFDSELDTIISYNGGERLYAPGLNPEMLEWFNKKDDASIIVYRLKVTQEQKKRIIDRVFSINKEGSAYNLLGLIMKMSFKPNILFCSQFIYRLLEDTKTNYFTRKDGQVKPTDLVELDYHRKLQFAYEITFNPEKIPKDAG